MTTATQTSQSPANNVIDVSEKKRDRHVTRDIVNFLLSRKGVFTIYDVYQQFPGKDSAVQLVIAVLNLDGSLSKEKRAEYTVAHEKQVISDLHHEVELLRNNNIRMSGDLEQLLSEIDEIRVSNVQVSQLKVQLQRVENEKRQLEQEVARLTGRKYA